MATHTRLKGFTQIGDSFFSDQLMVNLMEFFDWGLLEIGAFFNVTIPESGAYGGTFDRLRPVQSPNYTNGQVWEGARGNWVWQQNLEYEVQPIRVSGVYVDGTFHSIDGSGAFAHHVNYPLGRIVFDSPISTTSVVQANYSHRYFNWYKADVPWFRQVMFESFRVDSDHFLQSGSGQWHSTLGQNRVQLPAVLIEVVPRRIFSGMQLGGGQTIFQDVLFHILAESPWERNDMVDIITFQNEKTIFLFDINLINASGAFPLDERGMVQVSGLMYPDLVAPTGDGGFRYKRCIFNDITSQETGADEGLFRAVVRGTFEVDFPTL